MIVEYIRYEVEDPQSLVDAYQRARASLDASPVCLGYELSQCVEDPRSLVLRIEWESAEAHIEGFRKSAQFPPFLAEIRAFLPNIREMRHYELTAVNSR